MDSTAKDFHVLENLVMSDSSLKSQTVVPSIVPKGAASHVKKGSVEDLVRKYHIEQQSVLPENPTASMAGATVPEFELQKETAGHRFVVFLKAQGKETSEIAAESGYCETHVRQILAQPFARRQLARLLEESDPKQLIQAKIANGAVKSVETLIEIRDCPKAPYAVRASAANSLLDRFLGKPKQTTAVELEKPATNDISEMDQRLRELEARERDLIGRPRVRDVPDVQLLPPPSDNAA